MPLPTLKQRFEFDRITAPADRLIYAMIQHMAYDGHGDIGACGVAEFDLIAFAEAIERPPGETLRALKALAAQIDGLCVEHDNMVLFALAGAPQRDFDHLFKSRGFIGLPPNLPRVAPRFMRI